MAMLNASARRAQAASRVSADEELIQFIDMEIKFELQGNLKKINF